MGAVTSCRRTADTYRPTARRACRFAKGVAFAALIIGEKSPRRFSHHLRKAWLSLRLSLAKSRRGAFRITCERRGFHCAYHWRKVAEALFASLAKGVAFAALTIGGKSPRRFSHQAAAGCASRRASR